MKLLAMILFIAGCGLFIAGVIIAEQEEKKAQIIADRHRLFAENSRQVKDLFKD